MKTKQAWTPGPWRIASETENMPRNLDNCAIVVDRRVIAKVDDGNLDIKRSQANAKLIAKAPEMAEVLLSMIAWERDYRARNNLGNVTPHPFSEAERILSEAGVL